MTSHHATPQHTTPPHHITLNQTTPHHTIPHHTTQHHHTTSNHTTPHHTKSHHTTPHHTTSHYHISIHRWPTWNPMNIHNFPTIVNIFISNVVMVKMMRPAFVITPIVVEISNIVCHVPVKIFRVRSQTILSNLQEISMRAMCCVSAL